MLFARKIAKDYLMAHFIRDLPLTFQVLSQKLLDSRMKTKPAYDTGGFWVRPPGKSYGEDEDRTRLAFGRGWLKRY